MKEEFEEVADLIRVESDETTDDLLLVFRVSDSKYKQYIKKHWASDILFRLVGKKLTLFKE